MSRAASKTLIGAFVIGGVALTLAGIIIFGSGKLFSKTIINVMYFQGSVRGLNVGSPVTLRGVKIGAVKRIDLIYDAKSLSFVIPVYVEIDPKRMIYVGHKPGTEHTKELIEKGLRAQLEMQSMVTGQLSINLDFFPDKDVRLLGLDKEVDEIPTIPSGLEEFLKTAQDMPIKELMNKIMRSIEGIEKVVNSPNVASSLRSLDESLKNASAILSKVDRQIGPVMANVKDASDSVKEMARKGEAVPGQIEKALLIAGDALKQAERTLLAVQGVASENSTLVQETGLTLREVSNAARSIRFLTDYLQQHPESLLQGKKKNKGE